MNVKRLVIVLLVVAGLGLGAAAGAAAAKPRASVEVAATGVVAADGQTATIQVEASCARGWTVLEAFVTLSQPQASGMGGLPLSCTGREQTFTVVVRALDATFTPGSAQASAFVLIERRGRTQQAQDAAEVQLTGG